MASAQYSFSLSSARYRNGRTAMESREGFRPPGKNLMRPMTAAAITIKPTTGMRSLRGVNLTVIVFEGGGLWFVVGRPGVGRSNSGRVSWAGSNFLNSDL